MRLFTLIALSVAALAISSAPAMAQTSELDNEAQVTNEQIALSKEIPATLVVRVKAGAETAEILHTTEKLEQVDATTQSSLANAKFSVVKINEEQTGELDRDSSRSSWYFCFNSSWYAPTYYYYGYTYSYGSYATYNYGGYTYYWYRWNHGWWY